MHVYADLEPYVCCVKSCNELLTFRTRDQWLDHTFGKHSLDDIAAGVSLVQTDQHDPKAGCPVCQAKIGLTRAAYGKHVGRHLETIALASIPKDIDSDNESDSNAESEHSSKLYDQHSKQDSKEDKVTGRKPLQDEDPAFAAHDEEDHAEPTRAPSPSVSEPAKLTGKHSATFQCHLCPKRFTRAYNLRSHLRTHTDERPFVCTVCGKAFARQHDRKKHEDLHSGEKKFICKGPLKDGGTWGCGRRFARADALGRHFRSEAGRTCIAPLLEEEQLEREAASKEQLQYNNPSMPPALLEQYPALAGIQWSAPARIQTDHSNIHHGSDTGNFAPIDPRYLAISPNDGWFDPQTLDERDLNELGLDKFDHRNDDPEP